MGGLSALVAGAFAAAKLRSKNAPADFPDTSSNEDVKVDFAGLNLEKQRALDDAIAAIQENLRDPEVLEALEGRGEDPLSVILGAIEIPILPDDLKYTKYDVSELLRRYPVQIEMSGNKGTYRGNGIFWQDPGIQLTAGHVISGDQSIDTRYPEDVDVGAYRVDANFEARPEQVVKDDPSITNASIHGRFVAIVGFDPDTTSDEHGYKTYPGIAVKVTPGLAHALHGHAPSLMQKFQNSFLLILPPGEAKSPSERSGNTIWQSASAKKQVRAQGMSGSPMFVYLNGQYSFGGIFWAVRSAKDRVRKRSLDIGYVHGIDDIRRALK